MKNIKINIFLLLFSVALMSGCNEDDPVTPDPLEEQETILINNYQSWVLFDDQSVIKDDFNVTDQFTGFRLNIDAGSFTTENCPQEAWPAAGTWFFKDNNPNLVERNDGILVQIGLSNGKLTLEFDAPESNQGGRSKSVSGHYRFVLVSE